MVHKTPKHVETKEQVPIHPDIDKLHPILPLHLDFCFINGNPYFTTITGKIDYRTITRFRGRGKMEVMKRLTDHIKNLHNSRGITINEYHLDNEFSNIKPLVAPARTLHNCAQGQHEPKSERNIRTIKNRMRCTVHSTLYTQHCTRECQPP